MHAGVPTTVTRYLGTIHDFIMLNPITETPAAARGAIAQVSNIYKLFSKITICDLLIFTILY